MRNIIKTSILLFITMISQSSFAQDEKEFINTLRSHCNAKEYNSCFYLGVFELTNQKRNEGMSLINKACDKKQQEACFYLEELHFKENIGQQLINDRERHCLNGNLLACDLVLLDKDDTFAKKILTSTPLNDLTIFGLDRLASIELKNKKLIKAEEIYSLLCQKSFWCEKYIKLRYKNLTITQLEKVCKEGDVLVCKYLVHLAKDKDIDRLELICKKGNAHSCSILGDKFLNIVEENSKNIEAFKRSQNFYQKACGLGDEQSCANLRRLYKRRKNDSELITWLKKGCFEGSGKYSCVELGHYYEENDLAKGLPNNDIQVTSLIISAYKKGCDSWSDESCYRLGLYYEKKNEKKNAIREYSKACDLLNSEACLLLSRNLENEGNKIDSLKKLRLACHLRNKNTISNDPCKELVFFEISRSNFFSANILLNQLCSDGDGESCLIDSILKISEKNFIDAEKSFLRAYESRQWEVSTALNSIKRLEKIISLKDFKDYSKKWCKKKNEQRQACMISKKI